MKTISDLARKLAEKSNDVRSIAAGERIIRDVFDIIDDELKTGNDVRIHHFGSFAVKKRAARKAVNLQTRQPIDVPEKNVVRFKPAAALSDDVM